MTTPFGLAVVVSVLLGMPAEPGVITGRRVVPDAFSREDAFELLRNTPTGDVGVMRVRGRYATTVFLLSQTTGATAVVRLPTLSGVCRMIGERGRAPARRERMTGNPVLDARPGKPRFILADDWWVPRRP